MKFAPSHWLIRAVVALAVLLASSSASSAEKIVVGSKRFTE